MPPWRLESLTFRSSSRLICELCLTLPLNHLIVFWLSEDVSCLLRVLSSLPTWSVAGFCRFPTACVHTVKLKNLLRFAVVVAASRPRGLWLSDFFEAYSFCRFQLKAAQSSQLFK
ncbi:Uncharacterized protein Rs2_29275 [Raphanus sativus]|nr:Uncharacterized protein Rs2_29275 [Raphanus sativus]